MPPIRIAVLRGVCQIPVYIAQERGFLADEGIDSALEIEPTAWMVPAKLTRGHSQFAVIPWTRVAASDPRDARLILLCGSGHEEAAIVVRTGVEVSDVRRVTVPLRGGMKDLTAMALIDALGWHDVEIFRQPSGDGAIISLFGEGCDAASMVEPYATMMESLGVGRVVKRTGDVWPGAPGCSLTATAELCQTEPGVAEAVVRAFARGATFVRDDPGESAEIASRYIGVNERFIAEALHHSQPDPDVLRNHEAMEGVLSLMLELGYIESVPSGFVDLSFLDRVIQTV